MRKLSLVIIVFIVLSAGRAFAEDVLIVQSLYSKMYSDVVSSAKKACSTARAKSISLDDVPDADVPRIIRETRVKAVLAVGDRAFRAAISQRKIPVVGVLTLEAETPQSNARIIPYLAEPAKYLMMFRKMGKRNIAIVHDGKLNAYVRKADRVAKSMGINLVKREVKNPKKVSLALESLQNEKIDSMWIIPDTNVLTTGTVTPLMEFAFEKNIPAIVFSKNYLSVGATLAIEPDRAAMGKQAGRMVCQAIENGSVPETAFAASSFFSQCGNEALCHRFGISSSLFSTCADGAHMLTR